MSTLPGSARAVVIGAGIVGNSMAYHLWQQGWSDLVLHRQGPVPEPRRLDRPRLELHLPGRPLQGDDGAHARERAPVQGPGRLHRERRDRGRPHRGAHAGAPPADVVGRRVGRRAGLDGDAGRDQGARPVHRRVGDHRRLLLAGGRRRRLAAGRHDHARAGPGGGGARPSRRSPRCSGSTSSTAASAACGPRAATSRPRWSSSPAASGARASPGWPGRRSRSRRRCTR